MKRFATINDVKRHFFPRMVERERRQSLTPEQKAEELAEKLVKGFRRQLRKALV